MESAEERSPYKEPLTTVQNNLSERESAVPSGKSVEESLANPSAGGRDPNLVPYGFRAIAVHAP